MCGCVQVATARSRGLAVMTYGLENNDVKSVARQEELGVCAAIVDDVARTMPLLGRACA
jgi:glycerophosphoryl diester phosphodiesterase